MKSACAWMRVLDERRAIVYIDPGSSCMRILGC